jgi:hypothetical protein
MAWVVNQ